MTTPELDITQVGINRVGIIGYGQFGAFLHELLKRFAPSIHVSIYAETMAPDGQTFFSLEKTVAADVVILAVPIRAYDSVLTQVLPHLSANAIIVDIATVKKYTASLIHDRAGETRFISLHPMFGPESYAQRDGDVNGFRIALTDTNIGNDVLTPLKRLISDLGFLIVSMTGDAHDKELAETLFLTHYIGQIVARGGFRRTDIDTVSFGYLMDAVDSVRHDAQLFSDVNKYNPFCADVIRRFDQCEQHVKDQLLAPDQNTK